MKSIKNLAFSALLAIGAFTTITYTACNKDECKDVVCGPGTCVGGTCSCPTGYEGSNCQTKSRDKFIGTYIGTETCTTGSDNYSIGVTANSDDIKLTITNVYNQGFTAIGSMTGANTFSLSGSSGTTSYTGTGTLSGNQLTIQYNITSPAASNSCTFVGSK